MTQLDFGLRWTWVDGLLLVLVLSFAVRGWMRGLLSQLFAVAGVVSGLFVAVWLSEWVGAHWLHARPTLFFGFLKVLIAFLGAVSVVSLFGWLGTLAHDAAREGPLGVLEGPGGLVAGGLLGALAGTGIILLALNTSWPDAVPKAAACARLTEPALAQAAALCARAESYAPGVEWLRREFQKAGRRAAVIAREPRAHNRSRSEPV